MNKHLYKRVLVEQKTYPNAQEAIIDHIEMAITHAYINFEGADVEKLISKLQTCTFDILKAQKTEVNVEEVEAFEKKKAYLETLRQFQLIGEHKADLDAIKLHIEKTQ